MTDIEEAMFVRCVNPTIRIKEMNVDSSNERRKEWPLRLVEEWSRVLMKEWIKGVLST